jgi:putative membrane protein
MAKFQTGLALERTMLAWVRTALSMVSLGFGIVAFFRSLRLAHPGRRPVGFTSRPSGSA